MSQHEQFRYSTGVFAYPLAFVIVLWLVFWAQVRFFPEIKDFGIHPQTFQGLRGIVFSPFIHNDIQHIFNNTVPLFILSMALFYFYRPIAWKVLLYGILLSGTITWIIGRPSNHIGASGLVYVLMGFVFFKGIFAKYYRLVALSLIVVFLYGSMIWYVFPVEEKISWEGHLAGLLTGLLFAVVFRKAIAKPEKYVWQQPDFVEEDDPFLRHFDENGNFIEHIKPDIELEETEAPLKITYHFKKRND
ncbi:MAG TPA: rhomboid family intramembrane serine protease [Aquaticitalea sp.]|nr:rhomboid family intramembrane serine protease [Aquaticitalea sp.]